MISSLSVVVPVYNSAASLPALAEELGKTLPGLASAYELILVNDGSRDDSWLIVESLVRREPWIRGMNLMRNYGQHNALLCGIREAKFDTIATIDDDMQHPPREIGKLLDELAKGYDVVYGVPEKETHGLFRDLSSQISKIILQDAMGASIARSISAFRVFKTELRKSFENFSGPHVSIDVLLTWGTTKFSAVKTRHEPRRAGVSNYTFRKLIAHMGNMVTGFSILPMQVSSWIGFSFMLFGFLLLAYVCIRFFLDTSTVHGFAFLAAAITTFAGVQLFMIGIIGEYLARMHLRIMNKPSYAVHAQNKN